MQCCDVGRTRRPSPIAISWLSTCLFLVQLALTVSITSALNLNCDPCIDRTRYNIRAIIPPSTSSSDSSTILEPLLQTAADMNVNLDYIEATSEAEIIAAIRDADPDLIDALVVTAPTSGVETDVFNFMNENPIETAVLEFVSENPDFPIFGWGWGYERLAADSTFGWIADDADAGGRLAAQEFQTLVSERWNVTLGTVALIHSTPLTAATIARWNAFLDETSGQEGYGYDVLSIAVDSTDSASEISEAKLTEAFSGCSYQAVLVADATALEALLEVRTSQGCDENTLVGVILDDIDTTYNQMVYHAVTRRQVSFCISPQVHLQVSLTFLMASIYVSTGKVVAMPIESSTYWSGPVLIDADNVPSDTVAECEQLSFPVCTADEADADDMSLIDDADTDVATCVCTDRRAIRIGGVVHGDRSDAFWDPIWEAFDVAAADMNVEMDLEVYTQKSYAEIYELMSARIRNLCDSGIDGLFVTIPDDTVLEAVERCHELQVPVVAFNSGGAAAEALGLPHFVGQDDYSGGYGGALRLIEAGMKRGYCVDHAYGNTALIQRCQGFQDGIAAYGEGVTFGGHVAVPGDNEEQYVINLESAVEADGTWEGVGLLGFGPDQIPALLRVLDEHPGTVAGTFDTSELLFESIRDGKLLFGIDQQPYLQGQMPIYLLTYMVYTQQALTNHLIQSGPRFIEEYPSDAEKVCEVNLFAVCPDRPYEEMNYIPDKLLAFGYVLFGLLVSFCLIALAWTYHYRAKWVVKVSQPMFLDLVVFGCFLSGLSIMFMGPQTAYRQAKDSSGEFLEAANPDIGKIDAACMAVPWLWGLGFVITFSALFAKIQRVKLIYQAGLQMKRKQVTLADVSPVMAIMFAIEVAILLSWQLIAPLKWERIVMDELDGYPTNSVGTCDGGREGWRFYAGLVAFHVCCLGYALVLCFQTKDINSDFAESSYVSLAVVFMFQVMILAVPISALVRDSAEAFFFVRAAAIFLQNFTVLLLIFVPKMFRMSEESRSGSRSERDTNLQRQPRGQRSVSWAEDYRLSSQRDSYSKSYRVADEGQATKDVEDAMYSSDPTLGRGSSEPVPDKTDSNSSQEAEDDVNALNLSNRGKLLSPDEVESNWELLGFPSRSSVEMLLDLLRRSTNPQKRQQLSMTLFTDKNSPMEDAQPSTEPEVSTGESKEEAQVELPTVPTRHFPRVNYAGYTVDS